MIFDSAMTRIQRFAASLTQEWPMGKPAKPGAGQLDSELFSWQWFRRRTHPAYGITPEQLRRIMEQAESGYLQAQADLWEDMQERDGHIQAEISKRRLTVSSLPWSIDPPRNPSAREKKQAKQIQEWIEELPGLRRALFALTDGIGHGYSMLYCEWSLQSGVWLPRLTHRPAAWFMSPFNAPDEIRLSTRIVEGEPLDPMQWIQHVHSSMSGWPGRTGLVRILCWPYLFKILAISDRAEYLDTYGLPFIFGKHKDTASPERQAQLLQVVTDIAHNARGIMPESMSVEIHDAVATTGDPHAGMITWCEQTVSKIVLGGTLSSQADGKTSTNALGRVHDEFRSGPLCAHDAGQLAETLTQQLVWSIGRLNLGWTDPSRCPRWCWDLGEADDVAIWADALPKLAGVMDVPDQWARAQIRMPIPEPGEAVLRSSGGPSTPIPTAKAGLNAMPLHAFAHADHAVFSPRQQAIEELADAMLAKMGSPLSPLDIRDAIRAATDPQDLERRLADLMGEGDTEKFQQALERALFAADIMGYSNE